MRGVLKVVKLVVHQKIVSHANQGTQYNHLLFKLSVLVLNVNLHVLLV